MLPIKTTGLAFPAETEVIFDALGNQVRRQLLRLISEKPKSVAHLADLFPISRPAISRHLAQLQAAGLVKHVSTGTRNVYALSPGGMDTTRAWLNSFWDGAEFRLRMLAENTTDKTSAVLSDEHKR